jgi:uncharacterized protein YjbI with pentapeptide repeats
MNSAEAKKLLHGGLRGIAKWNERRQSGESSPSLRRAVLTQAMLREVDLTGVDLSGADLTGADLTGADLTGADLTRATFLKANLSDANLTGAVLYSTILASTTLSNADFTAASCWGTVLADVDLSDLIGLDSVTHNGPSLLGIDTVIRSRGRIPETFLRNCGISDAFITYIPSLISSIEPIQFYSCFISYSTKDQEFAKRLHSTMRDHGMRVWFAPEDAAGGKKLHEQIDEAIRVYDKLLLVLSPNSMNSEWVKTEIRKARKAELKENRRKLFPIRLVEFAKIRQWECFDADTGKDLAVEIREYFIPDFSLWKHHDRFEDAWKRLLKDLKA